MNPTELRYLYACLSICADKLGDMGCNDWRAAVKGDPEKIAFVQACENMHEDPRKISAKAGTIYGYNADPARLLMNRLEEIHGAEMFRDCAKLEAEML